MDIEIGEVGSAGLLPESLLVDLPEIDAQHEEIFNRIESLKSACFESAITPIDEFESLLAYFAFHFATEERLADADQKQHHGGFWDSAVIRAFR